MKAIDELIDSFTKFDYLEDLGALYFEYAGFKIENPEKITRVDAASLYALRIVIEAFKEILNTEQNKK